MAGAYVVFVALILVYVAIIGAKIARIEREIYRNRGCGGRRMTGELLAIGANHKTAPLRCARSSRCRTDGRRACWRELVGHDAVHEAVAISTCNRTELYLVTGDPVEAESAALGILSRQAGLRPTELLGAIYSLRGRDAVEHLFSVTAGLDSMIVGEAEIQGQVKRAYEMALVEGVDRPGGEPAVPRRARAPASACAPRPTCRARASRCRRSRCSSPPTSSAT